MFRYLHYFIFIFLILFKIFLFDFFLTGHFALQAFPLNIGFIIPITFWILFLNRKKIIVYILFDFIISVLLLGDLLYYRYYSNFISIETTVIFHQLSAVSGSVFELLKLQDFILFLDLFILILLFKKKKDIFLYKHSFIYAVSFSLFFAILGLFFSFHTSSKVFTKVNFNLSNILIYQKIGIIGFHENDIYHFILVMHSENKITKDDIAKAEKYFNTKKTNTKTKNKYFGIAKNKNVVLLQVEALQPYLLNKKIFNQEITPNLNELIKHSLYFDHFYQQISVGGTSDAEFLTNTSLYPLKSSVAYISYSANAYDSLANILSEYQYKRISYHGYEPQYYNRSMMHPNLGYEKFNSINDFHVDKSDYIGVGVSDKDVLEKVSMDMKNNKKPYLAFVITLSSHHPFNFVKGKNKTLQLHQFDNTLFGDYVQSIHYTDKAIGEFITNLKKEGLWDNTVFMLYGDHMAAEVNFNQKSIQKVLNLEQDDLSKATSTLRVPFILHYPGEKNGQTISNISSQIDVTPTTLNLLGINYSKYYFLGQDMLSNSNKKVIFPNGSFINQKVFYDNDSQQCFSISSKRKTNFSNCNPYINETSNELNVSETLIRKNLIEYLRKK